MNRCLALVPCFLMLASCGAKTASDGSVADVQTDTATQPKDVGDVFGPDVTAADTDDALAADDAAQTDVQPVVCPDSDQDGHTALACGGDDCDDNDPVVHPSATEYCDLKDNDCNGITDDVASLQLAAGYYCGSCKTQCTSDQTCTGGKCVVKKSCSDECAVGQKKCQDGCTVVECVGASGPSDCNQWATSTTTCPTGTGCNQGLCGPGGTCGMPKLPCTSDDIGQNAGTFSCASTSFTDQQPLQFCGGGNVSCTGGTGCPVLFSHGYSSGCSNGSCNCEKVQ